MRKTYVFRDGRVVDRQCAGPHPFEAKRSFNVMRDVDPFRSPIDGSMIGSRTDRRAHNKRHGVIDVGDDPAVLRRSEPHEPKGVGDEIARQWQD